VSHDDDLGIEGSRGARGVALDITGNHTTLDILGGQGLDVEANVVSGLGLLELLVVHLDGLDFGGNAAGGEQAGHAGGQDTGLDTADRYRADTADLVHVLEGQAEGLLRLAGRGLDLIELALEGVALPPGHVVLDNAVDVALAGDDHITSPAGDGQEGDEVLVAGALQRDSQRNPGRPVRLQVPVLRAQARVRQGG